MPGLALASAPTWSSRPTPTPTTPIPVPLPVPLSTPQPGALALARAWTLRRVDVGSARLPLLVSGPQRHLQARLLGGQALCGRRTDVAHVVFAESKRAEGKENQEVPLEETDDIHDLMVGPPASPGAPG